MPSADLSPSARDALRRAASALDAAEAAGHPYLMSQALAQVARCYRDVGALAGAETGFELALRWARVAGSADPCTELLCELGETAAALGESLHGDDPAAARAALERARDHAFEASRLAGRVADPHWEPTVLLRLSDLLHRCGDHDDACLLQTRALRLLGGGERPGAEPMPLPGPGRLADG
jgi:tetratricopeptide (TPR) repeat protein